MLMAAVGIIAAAIALGKWSLVMFARSEEYRGQAAKGRAYASFFRAMARDQRRPEARLFLLERARMEEAYAEHFDIAATYPWLPKPE